MKPGNLAAAIIILAGACLALAQPGAPLTIQLQRLVQTAPAHGFAGIHVVEVASGKVLFRLHEDRMFVPASNLKLLTSALALGRLKAGYRYSTKVIREASGDVVLVGSGDPAFSDRPFPYDKTSDKTPVTSAQLIDELAAQIATRGVTEIAGDIVGDDTLYPWDPYPPSWTVDDTENDYGAPVSALSINENVVAITLLPGATAGEPALLSLSPAVEYLTIDNRVVTSATGHSANLHLHRVAGSSQWRLTGTIGSSASPHVELVPVDDPALFAATLLYDALIRHGVTVRGSPVARHRTLSDEDPYVPAQGEELAVHTSPPLEQILQVMDKVSHNLFAEMILREVARFSGQEATTAAGAKEMSTWLSLHYPRRQWRVDDGSGLSRNALVTPLLLTDLLVRKAQSPEFETWLSLLPKGGEDGTLDQRLCCVSQGQGIRAKTGSLDRVSALSGYADSKTHGLLAFSILLNDYSVRTAEARKWIDQVATALLK